MAPRIISLLFILNVCIAQAQLPKVSGGTLARYEAFQSTYIPSRTIDVWRSDNLPVTNVIYMHDGQMLFDSTITWNKQEWGVDETLLKLIQAKKIKSTLVVAIWNTPARRQEYFPQQPFNEIPNLLKDSITKDIGGLPYSDQYLKFIVEELKPFIDSTYRLKQQTNTVIAGASMGGLISLYAICKYPQVFQSAICMSTHWPGSVYRNTQTIPQIFSSYLQQQLPAPNTHQFYFDLGTETLDAWYGYGQQLVDDVMKQNGYTSKNWMTKLFQGDAHNENAWRNRLAIPFQFVLK